MAEEAVFGIPSSEVTALVFTEWKFNEEMVKYIGASDHPELADDGNAAKALKIAKTLIPLGKPHLSSEAFGRAKSLVEEYGFDEGRFESMVEKLCDKLGVECPIP